MTRFWENSWSLDVLWEHSLDTLCLVKLLCLQLPLKAFTKLSSRYRIRFRYETAGRTKSAARGAACGQCHVITHVVRTLLCMNENRLWSRPTSSRMLESTVSNAALRLSIELYKPSYSLVEQLCHKPNHQNKSWLGTVLLSVCILLDRK